MNKEQSTFIKRLTELMEEFNMTQIQLAQKADITNVTISRYLSGERKPRIDIVTKIANAFSVSTDYLLGLSDEKNDKASKKEKQFIDIIEEDKGLDINAKNILKAMYKLMKDNK